MRSILNAGILQPAPTRGDRCLHCSLPATRGCSCTMPDNRRRPDRESTPSIQPPSHLLLAGGTWSRGFA